MAQECSGAPRSRSRNVRGARAVLLGLALGAALNGAALAQARPAAPPLADCTAAEELLSLPRNLQRTESLVRQGTSLRILAVGWPSGNQLGAPALADTLPVRLVAELNRRVPELDLGLKSEGIGGELAAAALERLRREVVDWGPDLVLWSLGTNDAIARTDPQDFAAAVREGAEWIMQRGVDLVLVDPPFFPGIAHEPAYQAYVDGVSKAAEEADAPLLRRYRAMQSWSGKRASGPGAPGRDSGEAAEHARSCLAGALAEALAGPSLSR